MPHIFTYGSLMRGQGNHRVLEHLKAQFVQAATIQADKLTTKYPFPAVKEGLGLVTGEVYEVNDEAIRSLDSFEGHPHFYQRRITKTSDGLPVHVYFGTGVIGDKPQDNPS